MRLASTVVYMTPKIYARELLHGVLNGFSLAERPVQTGVTGRLVFIAFAHLKTQRQIDKKLS